MKTFARFVLLLAAVILLFPSALSAQQNAAPTNQMEPAPFPQLRGMNWNRLGEKPLIPSSLLPERCQTKDRDIRWECTKSVILEEKGYEKASELFYIGAAKVFFLSNKPVPDWFKKELKDRASLDKVDTEQTYGKDYVFYPCGMAFGFENKDGVYEVTFGGNPRINFSEPSVAVFMIDPIVMKEGPYFGSPLAPIIPMECVNLTCMNATISEEKYPKLTEQPKVQVVAKTVDQEVVKDWRDYRGKKADAPSREELPVAFEARPTDGGPIVRAEAYDNKKAVLKVEPGKSYVITEAVESARWRAERDSITVTVGERNEPIRFVNTEIVPAQETAVAPPLPIVKQTPWYKRKSVMIPLIAAGAAVGICLAVCRGGDEINVFQDGRKGISDPGSRPAMTAPANATLAFGIGMKF